MEVDHESLPLSTTEEAQQPIRRAKRTYGKTKQAISPEEKIEVDDEASSSHFPFSAGGTTTAGTLSRYADWKERLEDVNKVSSDEEENPKLTKSSPSHSARSRGQKQSLSSPTETAHSDDWSREPKSPAQYVTSVIETQYSANTSINSGTTGAASSPAWPSPQKAPARKSEISRPGPPPHQDSFLSDEQGSMRSSTDEESSGRIPALSLPREKTPEAQKTIAARIMTPSSFVSPVKSFSNATASNKPRRPHKFLGADSEDEEDAQMQDMHNSTAGNGEEEHAWFTDGEEHSKENPTKGKVKQPSKKSIIEAEKETARIRAERDVDVQDKAIYRPRLWDNFFEKRAEELERSRLTKVPPAPQSFASKIKQEAKSSDPITSFSSPHDSLLSKDAKKQIMARKPLVFEEGDSSDLEIIEEEKPRDPIGRLEGAFNKHHKALPTNQKKIQRLSGANGSKQERSRKDHNREMLKKISAQSNALAISKKSDFESRGGILKKQNESKDSRQHLVQLLQQGVAISRYRQSEGDSDEDDPSYRPPEEDHTTVPGSSAQKRKPVVLAPDSSLVEDDSVDTVFSDHDQENSDADGEAEDEIRDVQNFKIAHSRRPVILSDEEDSLLESDGENVPPLTDSAVSKSSAAIRFDLSDVLSQAPRTPLGELRADDKKKGRLLFTQTDISSSQSSPSQRHSSYTFQSADSSPRTLPLLPAFDEPSSVKSFEKFSSPPVFPLHFGAEEKRTEFPSVRSTTSSIGFKPTGFGELSTQLFFSQGSPSQRASPSKRNRASLDKKDPLGDLRKAQDDDFLLTQAGPLGRIQLSTQEEKEIRKLEQADADAVLQENEEERRRRLREAAVEEEPRWINEAGLFTQTKPKDLPWSLSQNLLSQDIPFFPRGGELNAEQLLSQRSPAKTPARPKRLVRMGEVAVIETSPESESKSTISSPEKERNAFTVLMKPKKKKHDLLNNEFVAGEAEESDDDLHLGFKRTQGDDEEDEANIDPEEVAKMLNDQQLTKDEIAEEAIYEKHKEQEAADDAARQKMVEKIVNGQSRKHKRGYDPMGYSSSEDDDRARPRQYKKRRVKGTDDLDGIAANPETAAFFNSYRKDLPGEQEEEEEDPEFAHLRVEVKTIEDVDEDGDIESGSEAGMSVMSEEAEVREFKQAWAVSEVEGEETFEPEDLLDAERYVNAHMPSSDGFGEEYGNIQHVTLERRPFIKPPQQIQEDIFARRPKITTAVDSTRLAEWAKQNEKGRDAISRGTASAAVTGHGKTTNRTKSTGPGIVSGSQARRLPSAATVSNLTSRIKKEWD
ncbi:hypothetical protein FRC17_004792 [Serendipita sp. 399]|nr:hypothetical protein FRC17_004792 [Serendipita sp. 399]